MVAAALRRERMPPAADAVLFAERLIAGIDAMLSAQVDAILHHPGFQALEASWRQLRGLTETARGMRMVRIKVLDFSWAALGRDLARASEFDQSTLFRLVYSEQIGTAGGEPFGLLVIDQAVSHRPGGEPGRVHDDVSMLQSLAGIGAAAFCPILLQAAPELLDLPDWQAASAGVDLGPVLDDMAHFRWRSLRQASDTRFLGLTLPRVLVRLPWSDVDRNRPDGFVYRGEMVGEGGLSAGMLWGSAAFAFAATVLCLFDESGWFADLRGARQDSGGAGLVAGLPVYAFATDAGTIAGQPPVEVRLTGVQEQTLSDAGLIPVIAAPYTNQVMFNSNASVHAPTQYARGEATWNARISAMLQYILCVSRFAHYLLVMMRDTIGSFQGVGEVQNRLNAWLQKYCLGNDDPSMEARARFPLREAFVEVHEVPGRPGTLGCTIRLKPHFQIDSIATSFRLVTSMSNARA